MNLDDFLVTDNMPTPHAREVGIKQNEERPSHLASTAIPINKSRKDPAQQQQAFVPQSVPVPAHRQRLQDEFGYVPRHVRKTSIDEARVRDPIGARRFLLAQITSSSSLTPLSQLCIAIYSALKC